MVSSRYNHEFFYNGKRYLFNLLSVGLVELSDKGTLQEICKAHPEYVAPFKRMGFMVEDDCDEFSKYQCYYDSCRYGVGSRRFLLQLIPTYGCNLRCPYCYQGRQKASLKMGAEGVVRVLKFLDGELSRLKKANEVDRVSINLFGGEPMMDKGALQKFCEESFGIAKYYGLPISYDMTTNLTLLDEEMIALIRKFKIMVQVTIDGPKEFHDKKRITESGAGTYDRIVQNLIRLKRDGLTKYVHLRINVDNETVSKAADILKFVEGLYNSVYYAVIVHHNGANDCHLKLCVQEEKLSKYLAITDAALEEKGLPVHRVFGKRSPCSLVTPNKYFIDCHYDVYGCDCLINHPECKIGVIDEDGRLILNDNYYRQINTSVTNNEKCRKCKWAPACGGGCPATKYINEKKVKDGKLECQCIFDKESMDDYLINYIRRTGK